MIRYVSWIVIICLIGSSTPVVWAANYTPAMQELIETSGMTYEELNQISAESSQQAEQAADKAVKKMNNDYVKDFGAALLVVAAAAAVVGVVYLIFHKNSDGHRAQLAMDHTMKGYRIGERMRCSSYCSANGTDDIPHYDVGLSVAYEF